MKLLIKYIKKTANKEKDDDNRKPYFIKDSSDFLISEEIIYRVNSNKNTKNGKEEVLNNIYDSENKYIKKKIKKL